MHQMKSNCFLLVGSLVFGLILTSSSTIKKCCNKDCTKVISYGTTVGEFQSERPEFLSYSKGNRVFIYTKIQIGEIEVWEAKIDGLRGYIKPAHIKEVVTLCPSANMIKAELQSTSSKKTVSKEKPQHLKEQVKEIKRNTQNYQRKLQEIKKQRKSHQETTFRSEVQQNSLFTMPFKDKFKNMEDSETCSSNLHCHEDSWSFIKNYIFDFLTGILVYLRSNVTGNGILKVLVTASSFLLSLVTHTILARSYQVKPEPKWCTNVQLPMNAAGVDNKALDARIAHLESSKKELEENLKQCTSRNSLVCNEKTLLELQELNNLKSKSKALEKELIKVHKDNKNLLCEKKLLDNTIAELKFNLSGLEATRDQLANDRYNLEIELEKKEREYGRVLKHLQESEKQGTQVKGELNKLTTSIGDKNRIIADQNIEIEVLQNCLLEFSQQEKLELKSKKKSCGTQAEQTGNSFFGDIDEKRRDQLTKIEDLLKTSKVQKDLAQTKEQRDKYLSELQNTQRQLEEANVEKQNTQDKLASMEKELSCCKASLYKAKVKVEAITEYYEQKERKMYSSLMSGEHTCSVKKVCDGKNDKVNLEVKCNKLKEQIKRLEQEMEDLELSYITKISEQAKEIDNAVGKLQATEAKLHQSMRELTLCHARISELEMLSTTSKIMSNCPWSTSSQFYSRKTSEDIPSAPRQQTSTRANAVSPKVAEVSDKMELANTRSVHDQLPHLPVSRLHYRYLPYPEIGMFHTPQFRYPTTSHHLPMPPCVPQSCLPSSSPVQSGADN